MRGHGLSRREFLNRSALLGVGVTALPFLKACASGPTASEGAREIQLTKNPAGHILTNVNCFSPDSQWIVYDVRSDKEGSVFDGRTIEQVNVNTGEVKLLYESKNGANCGVVTYHPKEGKVIFILGPENPTDDWKYSSSRRQGVIVETTKPMEKVNLDARNIIPPFTPGALRGGSHVHVYCPDGQWVSFTYEDAVLDILEAKTKQKLVQRNVGVSAPFGPVTVPPGSRNHDGIMFTVLVARTTATPTPGSDEISRAYEEGWVGTNGYMKADGTRQKRAIAFQGNVLAKDGKTTVAEVFIVDLPNDLTVPGPDGPLQGTETGPPMPPKGAVQRRLTFTSDRKFPGIQGPRHWLRTSPDGTKIAYLAKDDAGIVQIWTVSPLGGQPVQVTRNPWSVTSTFTWNPDGKSMAYAMDNSIFMTDMGTGASTRLTARSSDALAPLMLAVIFSPDGKSIAYQRRPPDASGKEYNQIFLLKL